MPRRPLGFDVACSRKLKPDFRRNWPAACAKVRDGGPVSASHRDENPVPPARPLPSAPVPAAIVVRAVWL
jgi:hypothetical protein